jgi:NitT/TauT family transport system substrate-binding protein
MEGGRRFPRALKAALVLAATASSLTLLAAPASAELSEIHVSRQYGISYLPLMIMEDQKLIEKHAKASGIDMKVDWSKFASGAVMNDALLSGNLQFASGGVAPFTTLWAKTRSNLDVKAVAAINSMPLYLVTNNPKVKTLKDFTDKDKIALPAVKVSVQAMMLQMAAAKQWGQANFAKLDPLTVGMSPPDATIALLSDASEITSVFSVPPFQYQQLEKPGVHTVLNSTEVFGGPHTFTVAWTSTQFHDRNPALYKALLGAFQEATEMLNADVKPAAQYWIEDVKSKLTVDKVAEIASGKEVKWTMAPESTMKYAEFMHAVGSIKIKPGSWKDLFFPEVHGLPGS